ncbi:dienelactone hydrolase family protein [Streptomyces sp. NPDC004726]
MTTRDLDYSHGSLALRGFLSFDENAAGPRPGVIVVSDAFGLGEQAKSRARMLSELGYVALAIDMYGHGLHVSTLPEGMALVTDLREDPGRLRERAAAGLSALASLPQVDPGRLGAIGFCFGGTVALELARAGAELGAVVSFHGNLGTDRPAEPGVVRARVLVCHGADDPIVPPATVVAFEDEMRHAGVDWQLISYGGAKHSFTNPASDHYGKPEVGYHKLADQRSWAAMSAHFQEAFDAEAER